MNKFLSFDDDIQKIVYVNQVNDDPAADPADDVDVVPIDDARITQNSLIIQNQSSVPSLTSFLGDVYASGIIRSSGIEVTGNIVVNGKILSTSSSSSSSTGSDSTSLLQEQINELQTQVNSFVNQDVVNELNEQVNDLTFQNTTNSEINNLKLNLLILETRFNTLTNS